MAAAFKVDRGLLFTSEGIKLPYALLTSCTRSTEIRMCRLLFHIAECNAILWHAGVALTEEPEDNVGDLRLVTAPRTAARRGWYHEHCYSKPPWLQRRNTAIALITTILTNHRCIVAAELNDVLTKQVDVVKSLQQMRSLKRLCICNDSMPDPEISEHIYELFRAVNHTAEQPSSLQRPDIAESQCTILTSVPPYEDGRLTALDMSHVRMVSSQAENFIAALMNNSTITELSVRTCVAMCGRTESSASFPRYLAKADGRLRKLALKGCFFCAGTDFKIIVKTIAELKSLQELDAGMCRADHTVLFAEVVAKTRSLHSLRLNPPRPCDVLGLACGAEKLRECYYKRMLPWFSALRENTVLSRLAVNMLGFKTDDCCDFLRAVADNENLASVVIASLPSRGNLAEIARTIHELGLTQKITILDHVVKNATLPTLPECSVITKLTLDCRRLPRLQQQRRLFNCLLNNWDHITSLRVYVNQASLRKAMINSLSAYIEKSAALTEFELHLNLEFYEAGSLQHDPHSDSPLVRSLCVKRNLRRISFENVKLSNTECELLAGAIAQSRSLSELEVTLGCCCDDRVFRHLVKNIERNYSLLRIALPLCCWPAETDDESRLLGHYDATATAAAPPPPRHEVQDPSRPAVLDFVTCRNANLLTRAARFATGEQDSGGARALELVAEHPKLAEMVRARALVGAAEAETMVTKALGRMHFTTLDEFMKHAGVVRERVQRADGMKSGTMHLCDLNNYCWSSIRKYLRLADVKDDAVVVRAP